MEKNPAIPYDANLRSGSTQTEKPILPAATVAIMRDTAAGLEVLLLQRNTSVKFMGGSWVFPGGRVDKDDCLKGAELGDEPTGRLAAMREAEEEAGIVLNASQLLSIAHWTAPAESPRRFATWFYLTTMPSSQEVRVDGKEIVAHRWLSPRQALDDRAAQSISFLPPTFVTLEWLSGFSVATQAMEHFAQKKPQVFGPKILMDGDDVCNIYAEDGAYSTNDLDAPGPRHRFCMSKKQWHYEANF
jgi:8-oxo-dGTP pyrophosphatase MutT (NUDIX family)